ncbi:hypothetical protein [Trinickia diaoshuihuensis]|uniref:hypothetical protein n=1 Tax=Trinickia diaoshuihuensis TaxID=2292265 RepID=UPI0013C31185|nr:hypothetical protein [Trinickia diaoshuihuensis]
MAMFDGIRRKASLCFAVVFIFLLTSPLVASADVCPERGEMIKTILYKKIVKCPAGALVIVGKKNPAKYQSCLGDVPVSEEIVSIRRRGGRLRVLPSVNDLDANGYDLDQNKVWMTAKVVCGGRNGIVVTYWGGGNCDKCEREIRYLFNDYGDLQSAEVK